MKPITFKDSDEYRKYLDFKSLKDPEIKAYYKAAAKGELAKSKTVLKFEELSAYIKSRSFLPKKHETHNIQGYRGIQKASGI